MTSALLLRAPALVGLLVLVAFAGCTEPPSGASGSSTDPPAAAVQPVSTTLEYAGCRHLGVIVEVPKEDVQALLPEGFEALSGLTVFGNPTPPGVAGIDVSFLDCPAPLLNGVPTGAPLRVLSVYAPVKPKDDAGPEGNHFLLEHFVAKNADPAVLEAFRAAKVPVTLADIAFDPTDAAEFAHATIEVTAQGKAPILYDATWKTHESPAHALVYVRLSTRIHALTDGEHVFFDDVPGEKDQEAYLLPYALRSEGGVLSKVGTGATGVLAGYGESTVFEGAWVLAA